jgi:L-iditol 2-dehydrogenase
MRAVVYRGAGILCVEDVPVPAPGRGEMLVRVDVCGVCGTDIKKIQKGLLPGPRIFGHEIAGTVVEAGAGVGRYREGDRVALHHHIPCGDCFYCRLAAYAQCAAYKRNGTTAGFEPSGGGYAEYVKAMEWIVDRGAIPIPDGVSAEEAAFVEPVNTCLKCLKKTGVESGQDVLVVGQGPIGLLLTQLARWAGARVIASDTLAERLEASRRLGADAVLDAASADVAAEVRGLTSGRGADRTFVAALGEAPVRQAIAATRPAGRIMVFSATSPGESAEVDLGALCLAEKDILTSYSASVDLQDTAARLVFSREIRVQELVTHRFRMQDALLAFDTASRPAPGVLKVMLQPAS